MADSPITSRDFTVAQLFQKAPYALDYYQREYTWSREEVRALLDDLSHRFFLEWYETDDLDKVAGYHPYFLGPFVYHEEAGRTFLVDGQQRITTLHLLLIYLSSLLKDQGREEDYSDIASLVRTSQWSGSRAFSIDVPEEPARASLLSALLRDWSELSGYTHPPDASVSLQNLYERSRDLDELFTDDLRGEALIYFTHWLLTRVCLVGIKALDRDNAREIFVSMNDRGVQPSPADLLKSELFGRLGNRASSPELNKAWAEMLAALSKIGPKAASSFMKAFLLAHYADLNNEQDTIEIERSFHEWVHDKEKRLGLNRPSGTEEFLRRFTDEARHYFILREAGAVFKPQLATVFYNDYNGIEGQYALMLSALRPEDGPQDARLKSALAAAYMDLVYARRAVNNLPIYNEDLNEIVYETIPILRDCATPEDISVALGARIAQMPEDFSELKSFGLRGNNKRTVRYILARVTGHVEESCRGDNRPDLYLDRDEPYEIEHIWANRFERYEPWVKTMANFEYWRSRLGALLLLSKRVNASFRDLPYEDKVGYYYRENRLAASLHPDSRKRNPNFTNYLKRDKILERLFRPFPSSFDTTAIDARQELYRYLCEQIWNPERLGFAVPKVKPTAEQRKRKRSRAHYGIRPVDLIKRGLLSPQTRIYRKYKGNRYWATIEPDGTIRLDTGEPFPSLSAAGSAVARSGACAGWDVWRTEQNGTDVPLSEIRTQAITNDRLDFDGA